MSELEENGGCSRCQRCTCMCLFPAMKTHTCTLDDDTRAAHTHQTLPGCALHLSLHDLYGSAFGRRGVFTHTHTHSGTLECVTSLPRGMPLPRAQVRPMTFATNVLKVRYSLSTTPLRMVFISGIPEPGAGRGPS